MPATFPKQLWLTDSWRSRLLLPAAWLYGGIVAARRWLYGAGWCTSERLPVPTIVIGNFIVGGAGKTPLAIAVIRHLRTLGYLPGVIARGYGADASVPLLVGPGVTPERAGDEPCLIHARTGAPVCVGRDRVAAGRMLLAAHPGINVIVCDDGLQHLRLARDIEIAVFDGRDAGNGRLLPAGPLREHPRPVDLVVRNGAPPRAGEAGMRLVPAGIYSLADPSREVPAAAFAGQRVVAIAGIGDPERFFATLHELHVPLARTIAFPDHHPYTPDDVAQPDADYVLMTEKDAVKCTAFSAADRLCVLRVEAEIDERLIDLLRRRLSALTTQHAASSTH